MFARELTRRSQLVRSALVIFLAYCLAYVGAEVMQAGTIDKINTRMFGAFGINAVLISFTYVLVFVFLRKAFGFTSTVTLVELSDVNNPSCANSPRNAPAHSSIPCAGKQSRIGSRPPYRCQRAACAHRSAIS